MMRPKLTCIVISHNMKREIPRTIRSLSPCLQKGINKSDYEILLIENGSKEYCDHRELHCWGANITSISMCAPKKTPVFAINYGLELAKGEICGVLIDGARMVTPGLLNRVLAASKTHPRAIIATIGFHLGPKHQSLSAKEGYNQSVEDYLLNKIDWSADPYRLFEIAVFAGSSPRGWFGETLESNALFMAKEMWDELGGYEERFTTPGGGLANLDVFKRALNLPDSQLVILLGEGTFHQYHSGETTGDAPSKWGIFSKEYLDIRAKPYTPSNSSPIYFGSISKHDAKFVEMSAKFLYSAR